MVTLMIAVAAMQATAPATAAPVRPLSSVPGVKINYYDVAGTNAKAIEKSLNSILKAPGQNSAARVYDWSVGGSVTKEQNGDVCRVTTAKLTLTANAYLPRLSEQARVPADVLAQWKPYAASVENLAAENLWFVVDRLPAIEQSLVGKPCDQVQGAMTAATTQLQQQQQTFGEQVAARTAAARAAARKQAEAESIKKRQQQNNNY